MLLNVNYGNVNAPIQNVDVVSRYVVYLWVCWYVDGVGVSFWVKLTNVLSL